MKTPLLLAMALLSLLLSPANSLADEPVRTFTGHADGVLSVAFSPDGRYVLSGSEDKTLKLWEVATGKEIRSFMGHAGYVSSVAFSPDGRYALSGSWDKTLKLWAVATGKEIRTFTGHTSSVWSVAFSPDGRYALSGSEGKTLKLWEVETGKEIRTFRGHKGHVLSVVFSPDGRHALSSDARTLKLWEVATGKEIRTFRGHKGSVWSVAFSPDGHYALSGSFDGALKLWEVATGKEIRTFTGHAIWVLSVAFSPDGRYALSGSLDETLKLWEVATGKEVRTFTGHANAVWSTAFSPDGRYALSSGSADKTLKLWDLSPYLQEAIERVAEDVSEEKMRLADKIRAFAKGTHHEMPQSSLADESTRTFRGHKDAVPSVAFSPDGRYALSGSGDGPLQLWEVATGKEVSTFRGHNSLVTSVAFSPDGRYALSGSTDSTLKLWEVATGKEIRTFIGHDDFVLSVALSPDGRYALSGSVDTTLKLWEVATGKEIHTFRGHKYGVWSVAFSPDGRYALSGSSDNTLKLWEVETGKEIHTFRGHKYGVWSVAFSPDGRYALSGSNDKTLKLWEVATGKEIRTFTGHASGVWSVAFSPDGRYALSGSADSTLKLWEVATGKEIQTFKGHQGTPYSVSFSPDGRYALSGSDDKIFKLWDLSPYIKAKDTTPPTVSITSHDMESGIAVVPKVPSILIAGKVEDESGIGEVTVNGVKAYMDASGNFSAEVALETEDTKVQIVARDEHGNTAWNNFWLKGVEVELPEMLTKAPTASSDKALDIKGTFHAVVIGINEYRHLPKLKTAVNDARAVDRILREQYGFSTQLLIDPGRDAMLEAFDAIRRKVDADDHLLIYYAGHGIFDESVDKAYWLPADADAHSDIRWLIVDRITTTVRRMPARHVLIVADSCYSGTLTRNISVQTNTVSQFNRYLETMFEKASRTLIASGGNEPVSDGGGSGHSVFAQAFLEALKNPGMKAFTAEQLFRDHIKERVAGFSQQIPEYKVIQDSGHAGGDFVFIRKP